MTGAQCPGAMGLRNSTETRTYDGKNAPASISVSSNRLAWAYTTDDEGNISGIAQSQPAAESRTYGYQDFHYFLTAAVGPWGTLDWTYDKIGNRLSEVRNDLQPGDLYTYVPNTATPTPGHTATLDRIDLAVGGQRDYTFGPAGHLDRVDESAGATLYAHTAEGQLGGITRGAEQPAMIYDGRSFLREASAVDSAIFQDGFESGDLSCWIAVAGGGGGGELEQGRGKGAPCFTPAPGGPVTTATYGSEGLLYSVEKKSSPTATGTRFHLFYFAGRPVAEVEVPPVDPPTWTYLHTDHLGTPILATTSAGTERWRGGFEPFGTDWQAGSAAGASENGVFLRLPGQWVDGVFPDLEYNLYRTYVAQGARYTSADRMIPLSHREPNPYAYAISRPTAKKDPRGLFAIDGSCDCMGPGNSPNVPKVINDACAKVKSPKCAKALDSMWVVAMERVQRNEGESLGDCYRRRCSRERIGKWPLIVCVKGANKPCGETFSLNGSITLYYPGSQGCPTTNGQRDFGATLFHEIGHTCGIGDQEPEAWLDILEVCTGGRI